MDVPQAIIARIGAGNLSSFPVHARNLHHIPATTLIYVRKYRQKFRACQDKLEHSHG
jgi:hypothetical protein